MSSRRAASVDPLIGGEIGHFRILSKLGRGGMGVVYRAEDVNLWREVALKVLPPYWADDAKRQALFLREARNAASVAHANIATIYEVGTHDGATFIAMELVRGATLKDEIARTIEPARALVIAIGIARGLARAHEIGVLHRDLKPENVMLDQDGEPKLLDFGLARAIGADDRLKVRQSQRPVAADGPVPEDSEEGNIVGTPGYMSPEQARGHPVDARSDVFGLGLLLFELFSGRRPYPSGDVVQMLVSVVGEIPVALGTLGVDVSVADIVDRCLAREPDARFANAGEVRDALLRLQGERGPEARDTLPSVPTGAHSTGTAPAGTEKVGRPHSGSIDPEPMVRVADAPRELDTFVGRAREVDEVIARFDGGARLITLVGPGGIGKTRVAREIAVKLRARDRRPTIEVGLGSSWTADAALLALSGSLGVPQIARTELSMSLTLALRARGRLLVVLDEADAIADILFAPLVACLAGAPDAMVLVTSRVRPRVPQGEILELAPLTPEVGAQLFLDRASRVLTTSPLGPEAAAIALEISKRLDGSPLAIELAAARAERLDPAVILSRLDDRLRLLATEVDPGRHGSLRAVLDWSWSLLDDAQREVIAQMSVFRGGASVDAVQAVVALDVERGSVREVLESLRANSLVRADETEHVRRFVLDESVRVYAEERLRTDPSGTATWRSTVARHGAWFAARVQEARDSSALGIDSRGDRWLLRERENLLAAAERAIAGAGVLLDDAALVVAALGAALYALGGPDSVRAPLRALTARVGELTPHAAAEVLTTSAMLCLDSSPRDALEMAVRAVDLALHARHPDLVTRARIARAMAHLHLGEHPLATAAALEAVEGARGVPHLEEVALGALGRACVASDRIPEAQRAMEQAIASAETRGAACALPDLHLVLGYVSMQSAELTGAVEHDRAAIEGGRAAGLERVVGLGLVNLGSTLGELGRLTEAREQLTTAVAHLERRGEPSLLAAAHVNLALIEHETGHFVVALSHYDRAVGLLAQIGERRKRALYIGARAALLAQTGRVDEARRNLDAAHALLGPVEERVSLVVLSLMDLHLGLARARTTADLRERETILASVRHAIAAVRAADPQGPPLAKRSDLVRITVRCLEWVMRDDGYAV